MRTRLRFAVVLLVASACSSSGNPGTGGDDAPPDAPAGGGADAPPAPARGFQVVSPYIEVPPNTEITYCYYFKTPNTEMMAVNKWESDMTPGSHHMIMYTSATELKPEGTVTTQSCGFGAGGGTSQPSWTYSAQEPQAAVQMPLDDGAGQPVAMEIKPNTPAFFQMHYYNAGDTPLQVRVVLNAHALDAGATFTKTAAFISYYNNISIPPMARDHVEPAALNETSCNVPAGAKFWLMSTHAHKQAVKTRVMNGPDPTKVVFESNDWEHPTPKLWDTMPFYTFDSGKLTYECTYTNMGENKNDTITSGDSAADDEMCMASGYFFPATAPKFCFNNITF